MAVVLVCRRQGVEVLSHAAGHIRIKVAEGLVEQQQHRTQGKRAGERDALLLAAGELMRITVFQAA